MAKPFVICHGAGESRNGIALRSWRSSVCVSIGNLCFHYYVRLFLFLSLSLALSYSIRQYCNRRAASHVICSKIPAIITVRPAISFGRFKQLSGKVDINYDRMHWRLCSKNARIYESICAPDPRLDCLLNSIRHRAWFNCDSNSSKYANDAFHFDEINNEIWDDFGDFYQTGSYVHLM